MHAARLLALATAFALLLAGCRGPSQPAGTATDDGGCVLAVERATWSKATIAPGDEVQLTLQIALSPARTAAQEGLFLAYPTAAVRTQTAGVTIVPAEPKVYGLLPGASCTCALTVTFASSCARGSVVEFVASPEYAGERAEIAARELHFTVRLAD